MAFWSVFYIWIGFLCSEVSSGNCETMELIKIGKSQSHNRIIILIYQISVIETKFLNRYFLYLII